MGPMLFELTCTAPSPDAEVEATKFSRITHAGVLEFVADEGTIGLPRKVVSSLLGTTTPEVAFRNNSDEEKLLHRQGNESVDETPGKKMGARPFVEGLGNVVVRYVRLPKATFAKVVPETVGLSQVSELRAMLEHNMRNHATLTVGDSLSVWRRGKEFSMKVSFFLRSIFKHCNLSTLHPPGLSLRMALYLCYRYAKICALTRQNAFSPEGNFDFKVALFPIH